MILVNIDIKKGRRRYFSELKSPLVILFCVTLCFLSACQEEKKDKLLKRNIEQIKKRGPSAIEPIPKFHKVTRYAYPQKSQRNPFSSYTSHKNVPPHIKLHKNRQKQPLEGFPSDALRMVGILKKKNQLWALISAPDGIVYKVQKGDYLGRHYGQVIEIKNKFIRFKEMRLMGQEWEPRVQTMTLEKDNRGKH